MKLPLQRHGGNLSALSARLDLPEVVHDFSVNTHPFGPPQAAMAAARTALDRADCYPETDASALLAALAAHHALPADCFLAGNGATELIDLIPRALGVRTGLVVAPAFGEYGDAMRRAWGRVVPVARPRLDRFPTEKVVAAIDRERPKLVWLCSPNNPTGERLGDHALGEVLDAAGAAGAVVVLDESFVEYDGLGSRIAMVTTVPHLLVLRGFTKFYGLAGLRVGYLAGHPKVIRRLAEAVPPWRINRPAEAAAMTCLGLDGYEAQQRNQVTALKKKLVAGLSKLGLAPLPSQANFVLCPLPEGVDGERLYADMAQAGFLIRNGRSFGLNRHIRLRVHRQPLNEKLLAALAERIHPQK